ncbi:FKBP-type peptidyl-prolyl cis-trans isomerase [Psychromonas sp. PT13]|uniref:FKBP-type peptidyl-prolyl cis-trans isomerase n=1 Tax=Psychromonas sp. PT13 TaxID=3439547 RepID=UPI003EBA37E5
MSNYTMIIVITVIALFFTFLHMRRTNGVEDSIRLGVDFLADNIQKEGVESTESGLQYKVLEKGTGDKHPTATSKVEVHYHGTLIDGTVFDSSVERGKSLSFPLNRVISGWIEGVQLMVEGDKFRFYIPSELAYGRRKLGKIKAGSVLIFEIELIAIK